MKIVNDFVKEYQEDTKQETHINNNMSSLEKLRNILFILAFSTPTLQLLNASPIKGRSYYLDGIAMTEVWELGRIFQLLVGTPLRTCQDKMLWKGE